MLFMGFGSAFVYAPLSAIINSVVAKDVQGRVFTLYTSIATVMMPLGLLIGGFAASWLGIRSLYFIASAAWLVILPLAMLSKPLMKLETQTDV